LKHSLTSLVINFATRSNQTKKVNFTEKIVIFLEQWAKIDSAVLEQNIKNKVK